MTSIVDGTVIIQTTPESVLSTPSWFANSKHSIWPREEKCTVVPHDDFTPHGYLDNPYHSWSSTPAVFCVRCHRWEWVGMYRTWAVTVQKKPFAHKLSH